MLELSLLLLMVIKATTAVNRGNSWTCLAISLASESIAAVWRRSGLFLYLDFRKEDIPHLLIKIDGDCFLLLRLRDIGDPNQDGLELSVFISLRQF